jgi:hypothetical protein
MMEKLAQADEGEGVHDNPLSPKFTISYKVEMYAPESIATLPPFGPIEV